MILFPTLCRIRLGNARIVNPKEVCLCVKKSLLPAWLRIAGSAFYVWLICLRSFSVAQYRPGLLFCIWDSTAGNCTLPYLHVLWFGSYCHRLGNESIWIFSAYFPWVIPSFYPFILNWLRGFMSRERGLNDLLIALASDSEMVSHTASGVLPLVLLCVHVLVSGSYRRQAMLFQSKSLYL